MTDDMMPLRVFLEKNSDADLGCQKLKNTAIQLG